VATDILGVSGRAMLTALIDGQRDPQVLAGLAKARMRPKIPHLVQALTGNFGEHHAFSVPATPATHRPAHCGDWGPVGKH
jgi:transposase